MSEYKVSPRYVPCRDDKYMGLAWMMASFSKDPNTQVGAIIISRENRPLGWGFNGPPGGVPDEEINWGRPDKYDYIVHAEDNAIEWSSTRDFGGATLYVTGKPCKACMLKIARAKLGNVIYFPFQSLDKSSSFSTQKRADSERADDIARRWRVNVRRWSGNLNWVRDYVRQMQRLGIFDVTAGI